MIDQQTANNSIVNTLSDAAPEPPGMLEFVVTYAALGWRVFPVNPMNKRPLVAAWQIEASTDTARIEGWWRQWPNSMIGMVCGPTSGVAVVDADNKDDGKGMTGVQHWERLEREHGFIEGVPTVVTPSGGIHLYFTATSLPFKKDERGRIASKVDFRSATLDGGGIGYVVLPPSKNADGGRYVWDNVSEEAQLRAMPDAPIWLAMRACFNENERRIIGASVALLGLIEASPREEWRATFDAFQANERCFAEAAREHSQPGIGKALTIEHPYISAAITRMLRELADCRDGQNATLNATAFSISSLLAGAGITERGAVDQVRDRLLDGAMRLPTMDPSRPWASREGRAQAQATIESGWKAGIRKPRDLAQLREPKPGVAQKAIAYTADVVAFDQIKIEHVEWLWDKHIPLGEITVIAGDPKIGKSQVVIDMVARVSTGEPFPPLPRDPFLPPNNNPPPEPTRRDPAKAVIISAEDSPSHTLAPRLVAAGANLGNVLLLKGVKVQNGAGQEETQRFELGPSITALEELLRAEPQIRLVIIDPINAFLGNTDGNNATQVRSRLVALAELVLKHKVAVVYVAHLTKSKGETTGQNVLYRVSGSLAFAAAPRVVLTVTKDPKDPKRRFMYMTANNLARESDGYVFRVDERIIPDGAGGLVVSSHVIWSKIESPDMTAQEVLGGGSATAERPDLDKEAQNFLLDHLQAGPLGSIELQKEAKAEDIPWWKIKRAADDLKVKKSREGFGKGSKSIWELPEPAIDTSDVSADGMGSFEAPIP